jgi:hypothetical protein
MDSSLVSVARVGNTKVERWRTCNDQINDFYKDWRYFEKISKSDMTHPNVEGFQR